MIAIPTGVSFWDSFDNIFHCFSRSLHFVIRSFSLWVSHLISMQLPQSELFFSLSFSSHLVHSFFDEFTLPLPTSFISHFNNLYISISLRPSCRAASLLILYCKQFYLFTECNEFASFSFSLSSMLWLHLVLNIYSASSALRGGWIEIAFCFAFIRAFIRFCKKVFMCIFSSLHTHSVENREREK